MEDCHSNIHALMDDEKSAKVNNADGKDINVPSTSELISALVACNNRKGQRCSQCPAFGKYGYPRTCKRTIDLKTADRLKTLESELLQKTQELERNKKWHDESIATATNNIVKLEHQVSALTARAEQAEQQRDAAVAEFDVIAQDGLCEVCFFGDFSEIGRFACMEDCHFRWRRKSVLHENTKELHDGRTKVEF